MLTKELIKQNVALAALTDEQIDAITALSINDEAQVIGNKTKELHSAYDRDVLEVSGIAREQNEKSYDYVKRALATFKEQAGASENLKTEIDKYKSKVSELEQAIQEGSTDPALVQKLADTESQLQLLKTQYDTDKQAWNEEKTSFDQKMQGFKFNVEIEKALTGLKFKQGFTPEIQKTVLESTKNAILSVNKPDWIDDGKGGKVMVFRDENGEILRNRENKLEPYTAKDLFSEKLKDMLDTAKKAEGAGTQEVKGGERNARTLADLSKVKSQVEADEVIINHLMQEGLTRGSADFAEQQRQLREDNNIKELPIR